MFNSTQTYKDRLLTRLRSELKEKYHNVPECARDEMVIGYANALDEIIRIVQENDIEPVLQEPIKTK